MTLAHEDQKALALWAADCAERVLPLFEAKRPCDDRPWEALEAARAWACGFIPCHQARAAALEAHAAAREVTDAGARAAARAAGHAAATAHVAKHAVHSVAYAVKAAKAGAHPNQADQVAEEERKWQIQELPVHLRTVIVPTQQQKRSKQKTGETY